MAIACHARRTRRADGYMERGRNAKGGAPDGERCRDPRSNPRGTMKQSNPPDVSLASLRPLAEQALSRAAGAPLVAGNRVKLLRDATENYPAWLGAIAGASATITVDSYILADDEVGNRFATALGAAASRGVRVRLLQDWLGARGEASNAFWARLQGSGVELRWFNPFRFDAPVAWLRRNHRKSLVVDSRIGF